MMPFSPIRTNLRDPGLWLLFAAFAAATAAAAWFHQPWRDEALPWLIARDLNLWGIIRQAPSEGAPPLWQLMLMPLAKADLPFAAQQWLHLALAWTVIFLALFALPLPRFVRLLLPFTYYFTFEYSVIVRNYVVGIALLFALAALYPYRWRKPLAYAVLVALLAGSNVHSFAMAVALTCLLVIDVWQRRDASWRSLGALGIAGLGLLSVPLLLYPDATGGSHYLGWRWLPFAGAAAIWPGIDRETYTRFWPLALAWIPLALALIRTWRARLVLWVSWAWLGYIFLFKHSGALNHYGLILVFFLFAWCLDQSTMKPTDRKPTDEWHSLMIKLFAAILIVNMVYAGGFFLNLRGKYFSGGAEMAALIREAELEGEIMAAFPAYIGSSLLPYLPGRTLYQMEENKTDTIITWTRAYFEGYNTPFPILFERMRDDLRGRGDPQDEILLLVGPGHMAQPDWELLFQTSRPTIKADEFFYLYRVPLR